MIPKPPDPGEAWVATGKRFDAWGSGRREGPGRGGIGIARTHHQRFLRFLSDLGVDRFRLMATEDGSYVWAHLGFDFADVGVREDLKRRFREWLSGQEASLSLKKEWELGQIRHAWELADFTDDDGKRRGMDFLLWRGWSFPLGWEAVFYLRPDYEGWGRLFKSFTNGSGLDRMR